MSTLAVVAIAKNEGRYIAEWVAYHVLRGASRIIIYDNESDDNTKSVVQHLAKNLPVEYVRWPILKYDFNFTQKSAYEDAIIKLNTSVDFVSFIDIDEFLAGDGDICVTLDSFGSEVGAIACQQVLFGSSGLEEEEPRLVIERFTKSAMPNHPGHTWFKSIARSSLFERMESVHSVHTKGIQAYADGPKLERPLENIRQAKRICIHPLRLNHYTTKSRAEWVRKQARMTAACLPESVRSFYNEDVRGFDLRNKTINEYGGFSLAGYAAPVLDRLRT